MDTFLMENPEWNITQWHEANWSADWIAQQVGSALVTVLKTNEAYSNFSTHIYSKQEAHGPQCSPDSPKLGFATLHKRDF
jgi:hypothetical protein